MNKYEYCFHAWHGEPGKHKHHLTNYCKEGYALDSKTDERLNNNDRCVDWFGRCDELRPCKKQGGWVPRRKKLI